MNSKNNSKNGLKMIVIALVLLLCLALAVGITGAYYQAKRQATGTLNMDQGIVIDYNGFDKTAAEEWATWTRGVTLPLFSTTDAQPGEHIAVNAAGIRANTESVDFYARVKLSYKFYNGETPVELADSTKLIATSANFFDTNWVESGDGYYYYGAGTTLNKFEKGTQTFVDLFATGAEFVIEGENFTGATSDGEGGGFVVGDTSINKIEVYLTLETLQGDADAAAEGWKITEVVKPIEIDTSTDTTINENDEVTIDDIIDYDDRDKEITISGNPTTMKTILIGSKAFEGCTNLRLKLNNSSNITYIIASDAFSAGAKIWYGANEATNLLINADTTGKTAGQANAWVVSEPNLKLFLPSSITQNSTNKSYGKYQYTDNQGTWYFDLIDSNGKTVTLSSIPTNSVSILGTSTYANTNTYSAKLRKFVPNEGITIVNIPKFIGISQDSDKYAVTELYYTFRNCSGLTSITIPDSVTSIGDYAFDGCSGLTSITISESVTSIGGGAFYDCSGLTSITIPDSVESIGGAVFRGCSGLTSITIPETVLEFDTSTAFSGCSNLESVKLPENIDEFGYGVFESCFKLKTLNIPKNLKIIGEQAFWGCAFESFSIPNGVTEIGKNAFWDCSKLVSITIPNTVEKIAHTAFYGCTNLKSITVDSENKNYCDIENKCLIESSTKSLIKGSMIPSDGSVTTIIEDALNVSNFSIKNIVIPDCIEVINKGAISDYYNENDVASITIGKGISDVSWLPKYKYAAAYNKAYYGYTINISEVNQYLTTDNKAIFSKNDNNELSLSLYISGDTSYNIPSSCNMNGINYPVTIIGDNAFNSNRLLVSIIIPEGIKMIGAGAFAGCVELDTKIPSGVQEIGKSAFSGCYKLKEINLPDSIEKIGKLAFEYCNSVINVTIPENVKEIGYGAFRYMSNLSSVKFYYNLSANMKYEYGTYKVKDIFAGSNLKTVDVVVSSSVTQIGSNFSEFKNLTSITIPESVTSIEPSAFYNCSGLTSVVIEGNITEIPYYCFQSCSSLESIVLPASVEIIENGAFSGCSKLTTIYVDSASAETVTNLGFAKVDDTLYNENGIVDANGKYYKYSGSVA